MSPLAVYAEPAATHPRSAAAQPCRIVKASVSNALGNGGDWSELAWDRLSARSRRRRASQNGTVQYAPLWHGPALRPAFAAQVLGQVMSDQRHDVSDLALLAYRNGIAQAPVALLLDVSL